MNEWEFQLDQLVAIHISGERGHVRGRSHYEFMRTTPGDTVTLRPAGKGV